MTQDRQPVVPDHIEVLRAVRRDVCYFDNTGGKLRAPTYAKTLMRKLGLTPRLRRIRASTARTCTSRYTAAPPSPPACTEARAPGKASRSTRSSAGLTLG